MLNNSPDDSKQKERPKRRLNFLRKHLVQEVIEKPTTTRAIVVAQKVKNIILPALLVNVLGILAIKYPHFFDDADLTHVSGGTSGFIFIAFIIFLKFSWNQVGGSLAIALSLFALVKCMLPTQQKLSTSETPSEGSEKTWKRRIARIGIRAGINAGEDYIRQRRGKHSKFEN